MLEIILDFLDGFLCILNTLRAFVTLRKIKSFHKITFRINQADLVYRADDM